MKDDDYLTPSNFTSKSLQIIRYVLFILILSKTLPAEFCLPSPVRTCSWLSHRWCSSAQTELALLQCRQSSELSAGSWWEFRRRCSKKELVFLDYWTASTCLSNSDCSSSKNNIVWQKELWNDRIGAFSADRCHYQIERCENRQGWHYWKPEDA